MTAVRTGNPDPELGRAPFVLVTLFTLALFASAFLLFVLEPLVAKLLLPLLGGSPAVWTTCMLFFQIMLLAGYAWSHFSIRALGIRNQSLVQAALMTAPIALLPFDPARQIAAQAARTPVASLLAVLSTSIGLPFFALATTAPLLQRWFSLTRHPSARDPYFLYAASNLGSLAALILYPIVVEPFLSLHSQRLAWSAAYAVGAVMVATAAVLIRKSAPPDARDLGGRTPEPRRILRRARWLALSATPSGLMLAVTSHISTDIAAVPLLWIVPLALYLSSFIVAFGTNADRTMAIAQRVFPLVLLPLVLFIVLQGSASLGFIIPLHLLAFFVIALLCHAELARDRPPAGELTAFYLWLAIGGMLGGVFNTIAAPMLFVDIAEYPVLLVAACFLVAPLSAYRTALRQRWPLARTIAAGAVAGAVVIVGGRERLGPEPTMLLLSIPALLCFSVSRQPALFAVGVSLVLLPGWLTANRAWGHVISAERTFFGVYRITEDPTRGLRSLFHGTTLHGSERIGEDPPEPLAYYHLASPIADVLAAQQRAGMASVGVIGLGVGSLAAYARDGQRWTFYELDPTVERIARDDRFFVFLRTCGAKCRVVIGDGRLSISRSSARHDALVVDAFSSDAIPVHLLTREALAIYRSHLSDRGVMAFHISNRHFDLAPILAGLARDDGLRALLRADNADEGSGALKSVWAVLARRDAPTGLEGDAGWHDIPFDSRPAWTDDFSNVWSVLHWR